MDHQNHQPPSGNTHPSQPPHTTFGNASPFLRPPPPRPPMVPRYGIDLQGMTPVTGPPVTGQFQRNSPTLVGPQDYRMPHGAAFNGTHWGPPPSPATTIIPVPPIQQLDMQPGMPGQLLGPRPTHPGAMVTGPCPIPTRSAEDSSKSVKDAARDILSSQAQLRVNNLLHQIEQITDAERFYLYLQLPTQCFQDRRTNYQDRQKSGQNVDQDADCILTPQKRNAEKQARQWIEDNLQLCEETSLARKDVYEEYELYMKKLGANPLVQSDFGKVMRMVFPEVKSRRLGARGSSKYCYAGLRKRTDHSEPILPTLGVKPASRKQMRYRPGSGDSQHADSVQNSSGMKHGQSNGMLQPSPRSSSSSSSSPSITVFRQDSKGNGFPKAHLPPPPLFNQPKKGFGNQRSMDPGSSLPSKKIKQEFQHELQPMVDHEHENSFGHENAFGGSGMQPASGDGFGYGQMDQQGLGNFPNNQFNTAPSNQYTDPTIDHSKTFASTNTGQLHINELRQTDSSNSKLATSNPGDPPTMVSDPANSGRTLPGGSTVSTVSPSAPASGYGTSAFPQKRLALNGLSGIPPQPATRNPPFYNNISSAITQKMARNVQQSSDEGFLSTNTSPSNSGGFPQSPCFDRNSGYATIASNGGMVGLAPARVPALQRIRPKAGAVFSSLSNQALGHTAVDIQKMALNRSSSMPDPTANDGHISPHCLQPADSPKPNSPGSRLLASQSVPGKLLSPRAAVHPTKFGRMQPSVAAAPMPPARAMGVNATQHMLSQSISSVQRSVGRHEPPKFILDMINKLRTEGKLPYGLLQITIDNNQVTITPSPPGSGKAVTVTAPLPKLNLFTGVSHGAPPVSQSSIPSSSTPQVDSALAAPCYVVPPISPVSAPATSQTLTPPRNQNYSHRQSRGSTGSFVPNTSLQNLSLSRCASSGDQPDNEMAEVFAPSTSAANRSLQPGNLTNSGSVEFFNGDPFGGVDVKCEFEMMDNMENIMAAGAEVMDDSSSRRGSYESNGSAMNVCDNDGPRRSGARPAIDNATVNTSISSSSAVLHQPQRSTSSNDTTFDLLLTDQNSNNVNLNDIELFQ